MEEMILKIYFLATVPMKQINFYVSYFERLGNKISTKMLNFLPSLLLAIVVFIIGKWLIRFLLRMLGKWMEKYGVELSLAIFFKSIIRFLLNVVLLISVISLLGFSTTSFIALLSAAGLAIGLALQGSLANFAGGVLILFFKPFKVGDTIESNNYIGRVVQIDILHTKIHTAENKVVIMPNGQLANNNIVNASGESSRRIDFNLYIAYQSDLSKVRQLVLDILTQDKRIYTTPEPIVLLNGLSDSSLDLIIRFWTDTLVSGEVHAYNLERIKEVLDSNQIALSSPLLCYKKK